MSTQPADVSGAGPAGSPADSSAPRPVVSPAGELDLGGILDALIGRKWLVIAVTILGTAAALAAAFVISPVYRGETVMAPAVEENDPSMMSAVAGRLGGLANLAGLEGGQSQLRHEAMAILRSKAFTLDFVRDRDLIPVLFEQDWDAETGTWRVDPPPTEYDAYLKFSKKVRKITEDTSSGLVTLGIHWTDRELAADWANELVTRLNDTVRTRVIRESEANLQYLENALEETNLVGVQQAIYDLMEREFRRRMVASTRQEYAFRIIDPAIPPDADDEIWPKKSLLVAGGFVLSLIGGMFLALLLEVLAGARGHGRHEREA